MMFHPKRILVPTDLSDLATAALPYAVGFARRFGARLDLLFSDAFSDPIDLVGGAYALADQERVESLRKAAVARLEAYAGEELPDDVERVLTVEVEAPYGAIVRHAANADLTVMATHGRSGWRRALLGSVTETVLRETDTPTLTIRPPEVPHASEPAAIERIVCPVNFTDMARVALDHAASLASSFKAELVVLHVLEDSTQADTKLEAVREWIPEGIKAHVKFRELVLRGHASEQTIDLARREQAQLIVIGAQHRTFSDTTVIGVTTERITRHAGCPVLTVVRR